MPKVKYHVLKTYGGAEVQLHAFLTSKLSGSEWSASCSGRFTAGERLSGTHLTGSWVGSCAGLETVEKK
jgi:hypothetical protein